MGTVPTVHNSLGVKIPPYVQSWCSRSDVQWVRRPPCNTHTVTCHCNTFKPIVFLFQQQQQQNKEKSFLSFGFGAGDGGGGGGGGGGVAPRRESHINVNVTPQHEYGADTPEIRYRTVPVPYRTVVRIPVLSNSRGYSQCFGSLFIWYVRIRIQSGSRVLMTKNLLLTGEFFLSKIAIYISLGLHKGRPS